MTHLPTTTGVCVVIPMYDEAPAVGVVVRAAFEHFAKVVCVDDGSRDGSAAVARAAGAEVVRHPSNRGQGAAIASGIRHALRDPAVTHVVTLDADGQHDPADAAAMAAAAVSDDVQVVLGSRFLRREDAARVPPARRLLLRSATRFTRLTTGLAVTDTHNGLRVLRRDVAERLDLHQRRMSHASEILGRVADERWSWVEHPVTVSYSAYSRGKGQPGYHAAAILLALAAGRLRHSTDSPTGPFS